jgi:tetratricopeptide (TPR) repeat protein
MFNRMMDKKMFGTEPYIERGITFLMLKMTYLALREFNIAVGMEESSEGDYDWIVRVYSALKMHKDALKWVQRRFAVYGSVEALVQKASVLEDLGRKEKAIKLLENAKESFPNSDQLSRKLAYYYLAIRKDYQKALDECNAVIGINPEWPYIYEDAVECMRILKKYDEGIELLTTAIERAPDNVSLYARRGLLYKDINRNSEALADLLHAITDIVALKEYWHVHIIYYYIGYLHEMYFNDAGSAMIYYRLSHEMDSRYPSALVALGDLSCHLGNFRESIEWYDKAVQGSPDDAGFLLMRANALKDSGQEKPAIRDYKAALRLYRKNPDDACRCAHMGECYLGLGDYNAALGLLELAIEKAPDCADCPQRYCHEAYFCLCRYYTETGQPEKAALCLEAAIKGANAVQYNQYKKRTQEAMF